MRPAMRSKRLVGTVIGMLTAVALPLAIPTASWAADTPAGSSAAGHGAPSQAQWKNLDKTAKKDSALGVFGDGSGSDPVLMLPAGTSAEEKAKAVADIPAGVTPKVKISKFTTNELRRMEKEVSDGKWNKDADKYNLGFSYDGESDKAVVESDAPDSVVESLKNTYPADKLEVHKARFEQQMSRFDDYASFFGGASIESAGGGICTSGWHLRFIDPDTNQTADWMTTAGHCFKRDWLIVNEGSGRNMGWIKKIGVNNDIQAFVGYEYSNHIYTGTTHDASASEQTIGHSSPWNGLKVCVSGRTTYAHCNHNVTSTAYAFNWTDRWGAQHHTNSWDGFAYNVSNHLTQPGDSGAPVYVSWSTGQVVAYGSHSGLVWWYDQTACHCVQQRGYGVKISSILADWNATMP